MEREHRPFKVVQTTHYHLCSALGNLQPCKMTCKRYQSLQPKIKQKKKRTERIYPYLPLISDSRLFGGIYTIIPRSSRMGPCLPQYEKRRAAQKKKKQRKEEKTPQFWNLISLLGYIWAINNNNILPMWLVSSVNAELQANYFDQSFRRTLT